MNFTVGLIAAMGGLMAIVLVLIAVSPGTLDGATEMMRSDSIPKLDRISSEKHIGSVSLDKTVTPVPEKSEGFMIQEEKLELEPRKTLSVSIPEGSGVPGCEGSNECYIPNLIVINEGDTVIWSNDDMAAHTVTSGTPADGPDGLFDSSLFLAGKTFEFTFEEIGEYDYFCIVHPWMVGTVNVIDPEHMEETMEEEVMEETMEDEMMETMEEEIIEKEIMITKPETVTMDALVSLALGSGVPGCETNDECYIPYSVLLAKTGTVTWTNDDTAAHTITSGTAKDGPDGLFDSSLLMAGKTFEFTFEEIGEYDYFCIVHPWMEGKVIVS